MRTVNYLMSNKPHLPYLAVSLLTLRRHWKGPVRVYAWPESIDIVKRIAKDERLRIEAREWDHFRRGRNSQFESKQLMMMDQPLDDIAMYLDADTIIRKPIDELFHPLEERPEISFAATQFCDWMSTGKIPQNRVKRLRNFPEIDQGIVEDVLGYPWTSPNGGIFVCRADSPVLKKWNEWTNIARKVFISDETVLHLMVPIFVTTGKMCVHTGGKFNCSPLRFQPNNLKDEDVAIWHFHGDSNVRIKEKGENGRYECKSRKGVTMWWTEYLECLRGDYGGIRSWRVGIGNSYLNKLEQAVKNQEV